jgi:hypothetical protein
MARLRPKGDLQALEEIAAAGPNAFEVAADLLAHRIQRLTPLLVKA